MGFTLVAHGEATPGANGAVALMANEPQFSLLDNRDAIKVPTKMPYICGVFGAGAATAAQVRLAQPDKSDKRFQKVSLYTDLDPNEGWTDLKHTPVRLVPGEKLTAYMVNAADESETIAYWLAEGAFPMKPCFIDEVISAYGDTTLAAANTWENVPLTWNETAKRGTYKIVGMVCGVFLAANLWSTLARLVIPGRPEFRPGVPCGLMEADHEEYQSIGHSPFNIWGDVGIECTLPDELPLLEICSPSLITDENLTLYLQRVG